MTSSQPEQLDEIDVIEMIRTSLDDTYSGEHSLHMFFTSDSEDDQLGILELSNGQNFEIRVTPETSDGTD